MADYLGRWTVSQVWRAWLEAGPLVMLLRSLRRCDRRVVVWLIVKVCVCVCVCLCVGREDGKQWPWHGTYYLREKWSKFMCIHWVRISRKSGIDLRGSAWRHHAFFYSFFSLFCFLLLLLLFLFVVVVCLFFVLFVCFPLVWSWVYLHLIVTYNIVNPVKTCFLCVLLD